MDAAQHAAPAQRSVAQSALGTVLAASATDLHPEVPQAQRAKRLDEGLDLLRGAAADSNVDVAMYNLAVLEVRYWRVSCSVTGHPYHIVPCQLHIYGPLERPFRIPAARGVTCVFMQLWPI